MKRRLRVRWTRLLTDKGLALVGATGVRKELDNERGAGNTVRGAPTVVASLIVAHSGGDRASPISRPLSFAAVGRKTTCHMDCSWYARWPICRGFTSDGTLGDPAVFVRGAMYSDGCCGVETGSGPLAALPAYPPRSACSLGRLLGSSAFPGLCRGSVDRRRLHRTIVRPSLAKRAAA